MKPTTRQAIEAILTADETVTTEHRQAIIDALTDKRGGSPRAIKDNEDLLTIGEAIKFLKVSRATFHRMIQAGTVKPSLTAGAGKAGGRSPRFTREALKTALSNK